MRQRRAAILEASKQTKQTDMVDTPCIARYPLVSHRSFAKQHFEMIAGASILLSREESPSFTGHGAG
jgi:hypothetical protein